MPIQTPQELLVRELQDIQDAEMQASEALQRHMQQVENTKLRNLLEHRLKEGERLLKDVRNGLEKLDGESQGTQNRAARGLIEEADRVANEVQSSEMKQAVIIAGAQKLEHYCIAAWGTAKAMAGELENRELAQVMQRALDEGYRWDREMTELAESRVNPPAFEAGGAHAEEQRETRSSDGSGSAKHSGGDPDLKEREYRDEEGRVRHHTREYMERHKE